MNIPEIKMLCDSPHLDDGAKQSLILSSIAKDKQAIQDILEILDNERHFNRELLNDMNVELSRSHVFIESWMPAVPVLKKKEKEHPVTKSFILEQIEAFYNKYKDSIIHLFKQQP